MFSYTSYEGKMSWEIGAGRRLPPMTPAVMENDVFERRNDRLPRVMLHIDMDAFFASVEIRDNPSLRGKPVAVGGDPKSRHGVITAASYEARPFGVRAGMTVVEAKRLCPRIILVPVNGRKYVAASRQIMQVLDAFSPEVKPLSIDEASLNISGCGRLFGPPLEIGRLVKEAVKKEINLPCTVGIGPNRLVAKMAAELAKPDGLMQISSSEEAAQVYAHLPVDKMIGIGRATKQALASMGILTLGQLGKVPDFMLKARFGILGPYLGAMARGEWAGRMRQDAERAVMEKSIGHSRTFARNISEVEGLRGKLVGLVEMVARRVRRGGWVGRVLTVAVRYSDFQTPHHQMRLPFPTDDEEVLINFAWLLLDQIWMQGRPVRLLGVNISELTAKGRLSNQLDLFNRYNFPRRDSLYRALDNLRDRFGEHIIGRAMGGRYLPSRSKDMQQGDELRIIAMR